VEGINSRLARWLMENLASSETDSKSEKNSSDLREKGYASSSMAGWILIDYADDPPGLQDLIVEFNFRR